MMSKRQMNAVSESSKRELRTINGIDFFENLPVTVYDVASDVDVIVTDDGAENSDGAFKRVLCLQKGGRVLLTTEITDDQLDEFVGVLIDGYETKNNFSASLGVRLQHAESGVRGLKKALHSLRCDIDRSNLTMEEQEELNRAIRRCKQDYKKGLAMRDEIKQILVKSNRTHLWASALPKGTVNSG